MSQAQNVLTNGSRTKVFWIQIVYLAALAVIAGVYFAGQLPAWLASPQGAGLSVEPGVLFFGALGGVLLSLEGVFKHGHDWDDTYFLWHIARPLVGGAVAVVAVLILQAGILAVGVQPIGASSAPTSGATPVDKDLLYYVVAFLVGYREESFRDLIKKAADLDLHVARRRLGADHIVVRQGRRLGCRWGPGHYHRQRLHRDQSRAVRNLAGQVLRELRCRDPGHDPAG